jgi:ubiquinone/menaquinone biosynthesis C-methylase UbiE
MKRVFKDVLHKLVAIPNVYDFCQMLAGASVSQRVFREEFATLAPKGRALDVGGGTGLMRPLLPKAWAYCCLDPDPQKLEGFRAKFHNDESLQCSACKMLLPDESFDLCIMCAVSHHLTDEEFDVSLSEIRRVLRQGGKLVFMDSLWNPSNLRGRLIYAVDRGSFPRSLKQIERHLGIHLSIQRSRLWKVHHEYALFWCDKD